MTALSPAVSVHIVLGRTHVTHSIYLRWKIGKIGVIDHHSITHTRVQIQAASLKPSY